MNKPEYGDPTFSLRMPPWMLTGLRMMAREDGTTPSVLIRELVEAALLTRGYAPEPRRRRRPKANVGV